MSPVACRLFAGRPSSASACGYAYRHSSLDLLELALAPSAECRFWLPAVAPGTLYHVHPDQRRHGQSTHPNLCASCACPLLKTRCDAGPGASTGTLSTAATPTGRWQQGVERALTGYCASRVPPEVLETFHCSKWQQGRCFPAPAGNFHGRSVAQMGQTASHACAFAAATSRHCDTACLPACTSIQVRPVKVSLSSVSGDCLPQGRYW